MVSYFNGNGRVCGLRMTLQYNGIEYVDDTFGPAGFLMRKVARPAKFGSWP